MVTEEEWKGEIARSDRLRWVSVAVGLVVFAVVCVPCIMAGQALASGFEADVISVGILIVVILPISTVLLVMSQRQQRRTDEKVTNLNAELSAAADDAVRQAEIRDQLNAELSAAIASADTEAQIRDSQVQRQRFESRLANALEMAEGEPEVIDVIERSFGTVLPATRSSCSWPTTATRTCTGWPRSDPTASHPPAAWTPRIVVRRRGGADPDLLGQRRPRRVSQAAQPAPGTISALCVPVSIMGRTVGVIHATGEPGVEVKDERLDDLATLAKLAGAGSGCSGSWPRRSCRPRRTR